MRADVHMHTNFSHDSESSPEEMIQGAIEKGLEVICFTDHFDKDNMSWGLEDIFDQNQKPEELLSIFISGQKDELFFLLDGNLMEIDSLCDYWDDRIRVFTIINGKSEAIHKLKYNGINRK